MVQTIDWTAVEAGLRARGHGPLGKLLSPGECAEVSAMYDAPDHFRSRVQMQQFRFGRGEYQYFANPLPSIVSELRSGLYASLAPIASRWNHDLGNAVEFPVALPEFIETCHEAGQTRPTPLLLRYREGDFNCLHQDLYGDIVFPFQVLVALSQSGVDFEGGELILVEQQPRAQSVGHVIRLQQGEGVAITTRYRPAKGARGFYRTNIRHGVSVVSSGERFTLGLIFHDAK